MAPKFPTQDSTQGRAYERFGQSRWVEPTPLAGWKPPGNKCIDMLLTDADRKERIARIQQSIAELSALMKPDDKK